MSRWIRLEHGVVKRLLGSGQYRKSMLLSAYAGSGPVYAACLLMFHMAKRVLWWCDGVDES